MLQIDFHRHVLFARIGENHQRFGGAVDFDGAVRRDRAKIDNMAFWCHADVEVKWLFLRLFWQFGDGLECHVGDVAIVVMFDVDAADVISQIVE